MPHTLITFVALVLAVLGCDGAREGELALSPPTLQAVLREPDAFVKARGLGTLLPTLGPEAVSEVRLAIESPEFGIGASETELLTRWWAMHEPEEATQWAFFRSPRGYRVAAIAVAVETWAATDAEAVAAFLRDTNSLPRSHQGPELEAAQIALVRGWFDSTDSSLVEYIRDLGIGIEQQRALGVLARKMFHRDGAAALTRWAESLPDDPKSFKLAAFRQIALVLAGANPGAAVAWCASHCDGPFGSNVRMMIATSWAARDGLAAMAWLSTQSRGAEADLAVRAGFGSWLRADREAALRWMASRGLQGVEPWLQQAIVLYANALSREDPAEAVRWASLIEEDAERELAWTRIARRWLSRDESAAEAWLGQSLLGEEARDKARKLPARQTNRKPDRDPEARP